MEERVIKSLKEISVDISENRGVNLLKSGLIDSYEIVNLVVELEDEFEIEIDPELVLPENFETLEAICNLVNKIQG